MLTAAQAGELAPIPTDELRRRDARHTRPARRSARAVAGLAACSSATRARRPVGRRTCTSIEPGAVHADGLVVRAPLIVVCPGPDFAALPGGAPAAWPALTLCTLQMLRVAAPGGRRYAPALATGLSLIRYPAFTAQPAAARCASACSAERPELVEAGIHLIVDPAPRRRPDRRRHARVRRHADAVRHRAARRAAARGGAAAARRRGLEVRERWLGVYPTCRWPLATAGDHFAVSAPFAGARVVEVISGLGMTMALGMPQAACSTSSSATDCPRPSSVGSAINFQIWRWSAAVNPCAGETCCRLSSSDVNLSGERVVTRRRRAPGGDFTS